MDDEHDNLPIGDKFEAMTIAYAHEGDAAAGLEALRICATGLYENALSEPMRLYLAKCLLDLVSGITAERAMNVEVLAGRGRPKDPFPKWEEPLAAFAAILERRGYIPARIEEALSIARQVIESKDLDPKEARRIRAKYKPMAKLDMDLLLHFCANEKMRGLIQEYPPLT